MLFIVIVDSIILIIASFLKAINYNDKYVNIYEKTDNNWISAFFIFAYIFLVFIMSFAQVNGKKLMDLRYISPYKIFMLFGILGFIINFIVAVFVIIKGVKCKDNEKETINCYASILNYFDNWTNIFNSNM